MVCIRSTSDRARSRLEVRSTCTPKGWPNHYPSNYRVSTIRIRIQAVSAIWYFTFAIFCARTVPGFSKCAHLIPHMRANVFFFSFRIRNANGKQCDDVQLYIRDNLPRVRVRLRKYHVKGKLNISSKVGVPMYRYDAWHAYKIATSNCSILRTIPIFLRSRRAFSRRECMYAYIPAVYRPRRWHITA